MNAFLRIIRYQNLLIIVLTQYAMRWLIIAPLLQTKGLKLQFSELNFLFLVLSTVFLTAAGYVINDYFDRKTDMVNRPDSVVIGRGINRRLAIFLHSVFNAIGVALGFYIAFSVKIPILGVAFIFIAGILWFYSTTYKRQFLIGNLIVAALTALVPFMVILFEIPMLNIVYYKEIIRESLRFDSITAWIGGYTIFAFMLTLIREIIKDTEDFEGDTAYGRNTLPIVLGIKATKYIIAGLIVVTISGLLLVWAKFLIRGIKGNIDYVSMVYIALGIILPLCVLFFNVLMARSKADYHNASTLTKYSMLAGIIYAVVFNYIVIQQI